jgi:methionyl-tRNA synthetase
VNELLVGRKIQAVPSPWWAAALRASQRRFEEAYQLETFSIRKAAEALALHLEAFALRSEQIQTEDPTDTSGALLFLWQLRTLAWPVTPDLAEQVSRAFGAPSTLTRPPLLTDVMTWPTATFRGLAPLPDAATEAAAA